MPGLVTLNPCVALKVHPTTLTCRLPAGVGTIVGLAKNVSPRQLGTPSVVPHASMWFVGSNLCLPPRTLWRTILAPIKFPTRTLYLFDPIRWIVLIAVLSILGMPTTRVNGDGLRFRLNCLPTMPLLLMRQVLTTLLRIVRTIVLSERTLIVPVIVTPPSPLPPLSRRNLAKLPNDPTVVTTSPQSHPTPPPAAREPRRKTIDPHSTA